MKPTDWVEVERIYAAGIANGNATFAEATPSMEDFFASRISSLNLVVDMGGFRHIGRRERVGHMTYGPYAGIWRDTILVEQRL